MRAKYSVTHYETYSKGISEPEDIGELLGISAYKARKLQRLEDLPNERVEKIMRKVMRDG